MRSFVIRLIITMIAFYITAQILPGITVSSDLGQLFIVALIFGIVNAILKPIIVLLTCPLVLISLGLFLVVINALLLMLTSSLAGGALQVDSFGSALLGAIVLGIVSLIVEAVLDAVGINPEKERLTQRRLNG
jgi:putative membrane protein